MLLFSKPIIHNSSEKARSRNDGHRLSNEYDMQPALKGRDLTSMGVAHRFLKQTEFSSPERA